MKKIGIIKIVVNALCSVLSTVSSVIFFLNGQITSGIAWAVASVFWLIATIFNVVDYIVHKNK